jgi:ketosteroid isomerase-like protein
MPVTDHDVAQVRRAFETFDIQALRGGGLHAYFEAFYDDEAVVEHAEGFPVPAGRHIGRDGYEQWFEDTYGAYQEVGWSVEDVRAVGERVLAIARVGGRTFEDPTRLEVRLALVYAMRGGRIAHVQVFLTPERALEAARAAPSVPDGR